MKINELTTVVKDIALEKIGMSSFYLGNVWNHSTGKGDTYPCLWFEMPVLVDYNIQNKQFKTFTFALDFLMMPKMDDVDDEMDKISQCEVLADKFLSYLKQNTDFNLSPNITGISVKNINADAAAGIRLDIRVNAKRECLTSN